MAIIRLQGKEEKENGIYYEVDSTNPCIGEGGMGKVYEGKCVNTRTGESRPVAIKFLFMDLPDEAIERARREASIHLRNDNLVEMLGFIETDESRNGNIVKHYHVVSELLDGVSLSDIIQGKCTTVRGKEIPYARRLMNDFQKQPDHFAKAVIKSVLSGLMALHDAGYIHRDIDPSNIFITSDEHIKLIDFGISKQMRNLTTNDRALTVAGAFMGKPEYASPELALGDLKNQNQTTDIYAIGILLYQCIIGNVPFEGTRFDVLDKQVKEKLPLKNVQNKGLRSIIEKATDKRQDMRYQSAAEMRVAIENLDRTKTKVALSGKNKGMIFGAAALALLVLLAVIGAIFVSGNKEDVIAKSDSDRKHAVDSLMREYDTSVRKSDSLATFDIENVENFDERYIQAKDFLINARRISNELKKKGVNSADLKSREAKLNSLMQVAYDRLMDSYDNLVSIPDIPVEAANEKRTRADNLKKKMAN
ncbi:MAG: serine/threonine protein kinase [Candidatus Amulumruptor caecigallinarius]|nr:serine/threonine protein kinase [Candidatus Amulumruptor caecigallinarius]